MWSVPRCLQTDARLAVGRCKVVCGQWEGGTLPGMQKHRCRFPSLSSAALSLLNILPVRLACSWCAGCSDSEGGEEFYDVRSRRYSLISAGSSSCEYTVAGSTLAEPTPANVLVWCAHA